ncbi:hypothetical protein [Legionella geestiana]|uniref:hypothetical protein n=1 Tax=Legionella geestiana TaxID=45065 RepID=UPI00048B4992|nr:hypothetical protein [Legionella geestiana]QBS13534.1 hypothetical protein E4T54_11915 [Legionella geestiana]STX59185.1 Uncharacterised protein [Legionella geestiana]
MKEVLNCLYTLACISFFFLGSILTVHNKLGVGPLYNFNLFLIHTMELSAQEGENLGFYILLVGFILTAFRVLYGYKDEAENQV